MRACSASDLEDMSLGACSIMAPMPIPMILRARLRIPVIGAPMFIVSKGVDGTIVLSGAMSTAGNYLRGSVMNIGMDPDRLAAAGRASKNCGGGNPEVKAWKDVWSAGQSVSGIHEIEAVATLVERMSSEYEAARTRIRCG